MRQNIFLIFIITFVAGCKYEEGPIISLRSRQARVEGEWLQTKYINTTTGQEHEGLKTTYIFGSKNVFIDYNGKISSYEWDFGGKDDFIEIFTWSSSGKTVWYKFDILQLKHNEMRLQFTGNVFVFERVK